MERTNKISTMETENTSAKYKPLRYSNPVLESIGEWVSKNTVIINYAQKTSGGWEGWAQVELAYNLACAHGYDYNEGSPIFLQRESHVFTNSDMRVDIEILGTGNILFELKCQRGPPRKKDPKNPEHYIPDTAPSKSSEVAFADELEKDKNKIETLLKAPSQFSAILVIGISVTKDAITEMKKRKNGFTEYQSNYNTGPITIWYWKLE